MGSNIATITVDYPGNNWGIYLYKRCNICFHSFINFFQSSVLQKHNVLFKQSNLVMKTCTNILRDSYMEGYATVVYGFQNC